MTAKRAFGLLALILLAGCAGQTQAPGPQSGLENLPPDQAEAKAVIPAKGESGAFVIPWGLDHCLEVSGYFNGNAEEVQALLPAGFKPYPGDLPSTARMGVNAFLCPSGLDATGAVVEGVSQGSFWARVAAPEEHRKDGVCCYYVKWDTVVTDKASRELLESAGASVHDGLATFSGDYPSPGQPYTVSLDIAEVGTMTLSMIVHPGPQGTGSWLFREFSPTPEGLVTWESTAVYHEALAATGTIEVPAGSIPSQVHGGTLIPATFSVNVLSIQAGWIAGSTPAAP